MNWLQPSVTRSILLPLWGLTALLAFILHTLKAIHFNPPIYYPIGLVFIATLYCYLSLMIVRKSLLVFKKINLMVKKSSNLLQLNPKNIPQEIRPLIEQIQKTNPNHQATLESEARFASNAAHELKTPLATLYTHTQVALNAKDIHQCHKQLNNILKGIQKSTYLVNQLLDMSKAGPNYSPTMETVNLYPITQETIAEITPKAIGKDTEIALVAENRTCLIQGKPASLKILIRNLVDNAITYAPPKSAITVKLSINKHSHILLQVVDNGPGIPKEELPKVFDRFYRIHSGVGEGCGLGLSIAKQIASIHHATISLKPAPSGKGLTVQVEFPAHE